MFKVFWKIVLCFLLFLLVATFSFSATIYLKDGTVLNGIIVEATEEQIVIDTTVGLIEVPRNKIEDILYEGEQPEPNSGNISKNIIIQPQVDEGEQLFSEMEQRYKEIEEKKIRLYFMLHEEEFLDKMGIYEDITVEPLPAAITAEILRPSIKAEQLTTLPAFLPFVFNVILLLKRLL